MLPTLAFLTSSMFMASIFPTGTITSATRNSLRLH